MVPRDSRIGQGQGWTIRYSAFILQGDLKIKAMN